MLRQLAKYFGTGLAAILPFFLVIWVLISIFNYVDGLLGPYVDKIGGQHIPGVGFVVVIAGVTLIGLLTRLYISHQIFLLMDRVFQRIPVVKSLYSMSRELVQSFMGQHRGFRRAVFVLWPDERARVLGLVTADVLPESIDRTGEYVAVYLPNTFQFTGITVFVHRDQIEPCDLSVEDAFKYAISAGLGRPQ